MGELILPRMFAPGDPPRAEWNKFLDRYPAKAYHSDREAVSQGALSLFVSDTPQHFLREWQRPYVDISGSPEMKIGSMTHECLFEPHEYARYLEQPYFGDGRFKAAQDAKAAWLAGLSPELVDIELVETKKETKEKRTLKDDAKVITPQEKACVEGMAHNIRNHPRVKSLGLFDQPMAEQTVFWKDPATGILLRARLDMVKPARRVVVDLKTTDRAGRELFSRKIHNGLLHFQGAQYVAAATATEAAFGASGEPWHYVFIVAERDTGLVAVYVLKRRALAFGEVLRRQALDTLASCLGSGIWPAYSNDIEEIDLPPYAYSQMQSLEASF